MSSTTSNKLLKPLRLTCVLYWEQTSNQSTHFIFAHLLLFFLTMGCRSTRRSSPGPCAY